jgi:dehydrogenase/reductase SDR family protein 1
MDSWPLLRADWEGYEGFSRAVRYVMAFVGLYVLFFYVIGPTLRRKLWRPSRGLAGKVAIVTGASRGVGKGIALGLGEAGATVYVTGRTLDEGKNPLPGTISETAETVTEMGGEGIAVQCDHANDQDVQKLVQRVLREKGRIDILVNNAFAAPEDGSRTSQAFWEQKWNYWDVSHRVGLRSHYVASCLVAEQMVKQKSGLIVNVSSVGGSRFLFNVAYGVGKTAGERMAKDMAHDLKPHNVTAVALRPGLVKTERFLSKREALARRYKIDVARGGESAIYSGRAVAALAQDKAMIKQTGKVLDTADLAWEHGFTDIDGRQPAQMYTLRFVVENVVYYLLYKFRGPRQ